MASGFEDIAVMSVQGLFPEVTITDAKYVAVTTARNEEAYLPNSVPSILKQTVSPNVFVVVDDSSEDGTIEYLKTVNVLTLRFEAPRIQIRGINQSQAINMGVSLATKHSPNWEYLLKTDADVVLPPTYVEDLLRIMDNRPEIGIAGGWPLDCQGRKMKIRMSRTTDGARLYRRECWDEIGGLDTINAFDTHAILKARQAGWETTTIPYIKYKELRTSMKTTVKRWIQSGFSRKSFCFPLWHSIFAALKNIKSGRPVVIGPLILVLSHILSPWPKAPKIDNEWMKRFSTWEIKEFSKEILRGVL